MRRPVLRAVNAISFVSKSTARHVRRARSPSLCPKYKPNSTRPRHSTSLHASRMRLISDSVNARRFDSLVDSSVFTFFAGLLAIKPCRSASPRQTRSTFTARFAVDRESSFASRSRNCAISSGCSDAKLHDDLDAPRKAAKRSSTRL